MAELSAALRERARCVAAAVDSLYSDLPGGYDCDRELAMYNDSCTFGEIDTADVALFAERVGEGAASLAAFADLGSGLGTLVLAASSFFASSMGVENAPERAAVAQAALARLPQEAASRVSLVCGDMLAQPLGQLDVVFIHNMVFSRALERALQAKLDRELREGTLVYTVNELAYSRRCRLSATLQATYNWAENGALRPLYEYCVEGPQAPPSPPAE